MDDDFIDFILSIVVISILKPNEHAITIFGVGCISALAFLPSILIALFVNHKIKGIIVPICTLGSIATVLFIYINNYSPAEPFKRIVLSPVPSSLVIINGEVNDVTTFFEFKCNKDDMKKILSIDKYEKTNTKYSLGEHPPKWFNEKQLEYNYEFLVHEKVGSWIEAIYLNQDSTKAFYIMSWY